MTDVRLKLAPPWITYINKLIALFDGDPQIAFNVDEEEPAVIISTNNGDKAAALARLLPEEKCFGNVILAIDIDGPMSNRAFVTNEELFKTAFEGNPAFSYVISVETILTAFTYVVFKNKVVQFFNDNLNDINGLISTLYQEIASEIFEDAGLSGVCYNTDVEGKVALGLGTKPANWP